MSTSPISALTDALPFDVLLERLKETESKISAESTAVNYKQDTTDHCARSQFLTI